MHKVFINHWILDVGNFCYFIHCWYVEFVFIPVKIFGIYGERDQIIPPYCCTHIYTREPYTYHCLIMSHQAQWHVGKIKKKEEAFSGVTGIENVRISLNHYA